VTLDLLAATALERVAEHSFRAQIPDGWQQGRGAFGGLVLATMLRAMQAAEPDRARAARVLSGDLCGPVLPGEAAIEVRVIRRGNNQTNVAAELRQEDEVLALASAVLSTVRPQPPAPPLGTPPLAGDWQSAPVHAVLPPLGPAFAAHYEYRSHASPFPASGEAPPAIPEIDGWVRERAPLGRLDAPALIARLDAWWPTLFSIDRPRPVATISFVAQVLADPAALPAGEPLRYRARMAALHDGFFVELRELWRGDAVVALNQQTFAIIK
jgi:hypothetical protein